jgi:dihydropyrimidinase
MKLIKNGTLVFPEGSRREDILIDGEKIFKIGENLQDGDAEVLDASRKLIFPASLTPIRILIFMSRVR